LPNSIYLVRIESISYSWSIDFLSTKHSC